MSVIIDFFQGIGDAILSVIDFLVSFVEDIVYVVQLTGQFVLKIPEYFRFLPAPLLALIVTIFAIVVIYKVLGREG